MTFKVGHWIETNAQEVVSNAVSQSAVDGMTLVPSPYDVPLAFRVVEGDPTDPAYSVEVMYLGGNEQTTRKLAADLEVQVGTKSGRIYKVLIDTKHAKGGGRAHLSQMDKALKQLQGSVAGRSTKTNYDLVRYIMMSNEESIIRQLAEMADLSAQTGTEAPRRVPG